MALLDEILLNYRMNPSAGFGPPPIPGLGPADIAAASRPAMIGDRPMGIGGMNPQNAFPWGTGAQPILAAPSGLEQSPRFAAGQPTVTSLDGGGPIPLPQPRPRGADEISSRGNAPMGEPGQPMSLAPPNPVGGPGPAAAMPMTPAGGGRGSGALLAALASGFAGAPSFGSGMRRAFGNAAPLMAQNEARQEALDLQRSSQADIYRALKAKGVADVEIMAGLRNPTILKELADKYLGTKVEKDPKVREFKNPDGTLIQKQWDASTQTWQPVPGFDQPVPGERQSVPSGYRYAADGKTLEAIPGGPAEKIDAQVAARVGLGKSFLDQLPSIRKDLQKGDATGPIDALMAKVGQGRAGELRRQIDSGAEALLRNLTGAGMNMTEASEYAGRYRLQPWDTVSTISSKMNQLERELQYVMTAVSKGRGGTPTVVNGKLVIGDTEAPTSTAAPSGRTRGGMSWSVVQ